MAAKVTPTKTREPVGRTADGHPRFSNEDTIVIEKLAGTCDTARHVANEAIVSSTPPDVWHSLCRHVIVDGQGRVLKCSCICHTDAHHCTLCGADEELDPKSLRCVDVEACATRWKANIAASPRGRKIAEWDKATKAEKANRPTEDGEPKQAKAPKPTTGVCNHCGMTTKGGLFVAGHDAKLKGILKRRAVNHGSPWALAEATARGWVKPGSPAWKGLDGETATKAELIGQTYAEHLIVQACTLARLEQVEAGEDPESATGTADAIARMLATLANNEVG